MEANDAHGPKKNNALNTIGIITVGVVGSVFVYVSIIGLQALYVSETSAVAVQKSFGAQGEVKDSLKADQVGNISDVGRRMSVFGPSNTQLLIVGIDAAKKLVVRDAGDPSRLVPAIGPSIKPSIAPLFGRPQPLPAEPPPAPPVDGAAPAIDPATGLPVAPAVDGAVPAPGATGAAAGAGTAAPATGAAGAAGTPTPGATPAGPPTGAPPATPPPATGPTASGAPRPTTTPAPAAGGATPPAPATPPATR